MAEFTLLGTDACHLCEEAESLLLQAGLNFIKLDIINHESLQPLYALRIPVVLHIPSGLELSWPFAFEQLETFIDSIDSSSES